MLYLKKDYQAVFYSCDVYKGPISLLHKTHISSNLYCKKLEGLQNVWGFHNANHQSTRYEFNSFLSGWHQWPEVGKFKLYVR